MVTEYRDRADQLIEQAQAAVDRTNAQLARTDAITASMDQVTANMAELSGHVSALAGVARGISSAATAPLTGVSAFVFGLRRAMLVRRTLHVASVSPRPWSRQPIAGPAAERPRHRQRRHRPRQGGEPPVIRRGFWLATGAVLGVTGYRRVDAAGRALTAGRGHAP